jgi:preprotein translocase SecE subunit
MAKALARAQAFLGGVREELKQVVWPSRDELLGSALVVFVGVALLASFLGICDVVLSRVTQLFLQ